MTALILSSGRQFRSADELLNYADELEEANLQLKQELGLTPDSELLSKITARWKLSRREAQIVQYLYARGGMIASKDQLMNALYAERNDEPEIKIVDVFVCKTRAKIGADAIVTEWGRGYRLSAEGLRRVREVVDMPLSEIEVSPIAPTTRPKRVNLQVKALRIFVALAQPGAPAEMTISDLAAKFPERMSYGQASSVVNTLLRANRIVHTTHRKNQRGDLCNVYTMTDVGRRYLRDHAAEV